MVRWMLSLLVAGCSPECVGKDDNGFMEVCLEGQTYKYRDLECAEPTTIVWDHVSLSVTTEGADFRDGALSWNDAVGITMFCPDCREDWDVHVRLSDRVVGRTRHQMFLGRLVALVDVGESLSARDADFVLTHELGHVLGLAHDESCQSIMYPQPLVTDCVWGDPGITRHDADLLRDLYGNDMLDSR